MYKYENNIVAQWRFRDFFSMVQALYAVADGDLEYACSGFEKINVAHALNMKSLCDRLGTMTRVRAPSPVALEPLRIIDVVKGSDGVIRFQHSIPGSDTTGQFPVSSFPG
jgi:hypothetical protein